jgi:hypothetical protein
MMFSAPGAVVPLIGGLSSVYPTVNAAMIEVDEQIEGRTNRQVELAG